MKPWERISITLILCVTLLAAVWLHGVLNRYEVIAPEDSFIVTRYDRITGRAWVMTASGKTPMIELGVKREQTGESQQNQSPKESGLDRFEEFEKALPPLNGK
jgi:hypothetical protein